MLLRIFTFPYRVFVFLRVVLRDLPKFARDLRESYVLGYDSSMYEASREPDNGDPFLRAWQQDVRWRLYKRYQAYEARKAAYEASEAKGEEC